MVSPDPGNLKAASYYAELLNADLAFIDKRRQSSTSVAMETIVGDIVGKTILMFDDMIATGGTIAEAAVILKKHGAGKMYVAATHGVFAGKWHRAPGKIPPWNASSSPTPSPHVTASNPRLPCITHLS